MELILLTLVVSFGTSVISGLSGGGGGLILIPFYVFIGLTPQQAVATGKVAGLGVAGGALTAFKGKNLVDKRILYQLMAITIIASFGAAWFIPHINDQIFQYIIGVLVIVMVPVLFIDKDRLRPTKRFRFWRGLGYGIYFILSIIQGTFGTGLALLLVIDLMLLFGMNALEANATKRVAQFAQASLLFILLLFQGLVVMKLALATFIGSFVGCHVGSSFALRKGEQFIKVFMAILMVVSGVALIVTAK